jgi:hypothetical protein
LVIIPRNEGGASARQQPNELDLKAVEILHLIHEDSRIPRDVLRIFNESEIHTEDRVVKADGIVVSGTINIKVCGFACGNVAHQPDEVRRFRTPRQFPVAFDKRSEKRKVVESLGEAATQSRTSVQQMAAVPMERKHASKLSERPFEVILEIIDKRKNERLISLRSESLKKLLKEIGLASPWTGDYYFFGLRRSEDCFEGGRELSFQF